MLFRMGRAATTKWSRPTTAIGLALVLLASAMPASADRRAPGNPEDATVAPAVAAGDLASISATRWIVQLKEPSVAKYRGGRAGLDATSPIATGEERLDVTSTRSQAYRAHLRNGQNAVASEVARVAPGARVERSYQVALNGLAVTMSASQADAVRHLPNVRAVTPDVPYQLQMYATPEQIGAPALWQQLGGQAHAGEGVKVAIIDSGVFVKKNPDGTYGGNPCFNDVGYRAPSGFPKGDTRFTNNKVIVARAYFRPDDPPAAGENQPVQGTADASPHGTHVAGTVACNANTQAFPGVTISGIAPRAYLMNYRVFYPSVSTQDFQNGNAYVAELVQAIEDAVEDGADVISNSWGSTYQNTFAWADPMVQAAEGAVDAGVTMVFAQGNSGPEHATGNSPANSPKVIAVGAVTKFKTLIFASVDVTAPTPVPANLTNLDTGAAQFGPEVTSVVGPAGIVPAERVATNASSLACSLANDVSPFPAGSLGGKIALIQRGTCNFSEKVFNAQRGGAIGALVYNSTAGGDNLQSMAAGVHADDVTIPSLFLRRSDGLRMRDFANANPTTAQAQMAFRPHSADNVGNVMAGFSSRGPTQDKLVKPDVVAPGVDVVSGGYANAGYPGRFTGFGSVSGTSMATPHVAGAAALLKQLHPKWKPAEIKSALMTTANEQVFLDTDRTETAGVLDRGAGLIDLTKAGDPGLLLDQPSLSPGELAAGQSRNFTIRAQNVKPATTRWSVAVQAPPGIAVTTDDSLMVPGNAGANLSVRIAVAPTTALGRYEGALVLTSGSTRLHVPFALRVVPASATKDVLLVDDDGSGFVAALGDYSVTYKALLDGLGVSYDYLDITQSAFPGINTLSSYRAVMIFTGNNTSFDTSGFFPEDHDVLTEFLDSGGRLFTTGKNFAETSDDNTDFNSPTIGLARLYHGYLGLRLEDGNVFGGQAPAPTATGLGPMATLTLNLSGSNQDSVEASSPMPDNDTFQAAETLVPFFRQIGGHAVPANTAISFGRASEPSLEESRQKFVYRSVSMGFGLEGVNGGGGASSAQIARRALDWLLDTLTVATPTVRINPGRSATFTATATSSSGAAITRYRWDFGDGSPVVTTTSPTVEHTFVSGRVFTVRVEATDALGHRAVGTTTAVIGGN